MGWKKSNTGAAASRPTRGGLSPRARLVVMVTDQLSHNMLHSATLRATRLDLPIIYSRRSAIELRGKLAQL